ncbi:hypothetical protein C8J57DRAFT_1556805 [Mycena rebaudengoi]|nr:hypothetical protein C8J57DRAFT_1556805 [Mycena rebaudengoi]
MTFTISAASKMIVAILALTLACIALMTFISAILDTLSPTNRYIFFFVGSLATVPGPGRAHISPVTFEPQNYGHNFDVLGNVQLEQMDIDFDLESDSYRTSESDTGPCDTQWDPPQYFPARHQLDRPTLWPPPQFPDPPHFLTSRMLGTMIPQKPVIFSPPKYTRQLYSRSRKLSACPTKRPGLGAEALLPARTLAFQQNPSLLLYQSRHCCCASGEPSERPRRRMGNHLPMLFLLIPFRIPFSHNDLSHLRSPTAESPIRRQSTARIYLQRSGRYRYLVPRPRFIQMPFLFAHEITARGIGKARHVSPPRILTSIKWKGRAVEDVRISLSFEAWAAVPAWLPLDHLCNRLSAISPHHPARAGPIRQQMQNQRRDFVFDHDIQMLA